MNSFAAANEISRRYISAKYGETDKSGWKALAIDAAKVIEMVKAEKSEVFTNGPRVHGRRQQSQLDILDNREMRMCAVFDNATAAMIAAC